MTFANSISNHVITRSLTILILCVDRNVLHQILVIFQSVQLGMFHR